MSEARGSARLWWGFGIVLVMIAILVATALLGSAWALKRVIAAEGFEGEVRHCLQEGLGVDVVLDPIESRGMVFAQCPSAWLVAKDRTWAVRLVNVKSELNPRGLFRRAFEFRSVRIQEAHFWFGMVPEEAPELVAGLPRARDVSNWVAALLPRTVRFGPGCRLEAVTLHARGASAAGGAPVFQLEAEGAASFRNDRLSWRLKEGEIASIMSGEWRLEELSGFLEATEFGLERGEFRSARGGVISFSPAQGAPGKPLVLPVEGSGLTFEPAAPDQEEPVGPVNRVQADFRGELETQLPFAHRVRFTGDFHAEGLQLGKSRVFELLASQTGEEQLRKLTNGEATGLLQWSPGLVRLEELQFREEELVRLDGWMSVAGPELAGVFELSLPANLVSQIPGGKPRGFSYPASGWSTAQLQVEGRIGSWREDLTRRLVDQVSSEIGVAPAPVIEGGSFVDRDRRPSPKELNRMFEELFQELISRESGAAGGASS